MHPRYELLLHGNNLSFRGGFFGLCNVVLVWDASGEPMLFDTGHFCVRGSLVKALNARGIATGDLKHVFLSHLHFDHCHNIDLFTRATIHVGARELEYASNPHPEDIYIPWKITELFGERHVNPLPSEGDLLSGLRHFEVPGHTPGSQALAFTDANGKNVVLAGDAVKYSRELIAEVSDQSFGRAEDSSASIRRIAKAADVIVPGHFPVLFKRGNGWLWDEPATLELIVR
jgi:N-acyl homoserine lactone hydrolase